MFWFLYLLISLVLITFIFNTMASLVVAVRVPLFPTFLWFIKLPIMVLYFKLMPRRYKANFLNICNLAEDYKSFC